ncbi:MAG: DinB family protein [Fimbriimonadaceae bacterium]|nr:DinB family protein [Fimbriimonadaceae bacterium]
MTQFAISWRLSRGRFLDAIKDLNQEQLNWRLQPGSLTLGEAALHVAGVEVSFVSQLTDATLDDLRSKLKLAATEGVVNDNPFPFTADEITPELVAMSLDLAEQMARPLLENPSRAVLEKEIVSALGPVITGEGALARFAFHPGYHQGQAHLIRTAPGFPA